MPQNITQYYSERFEPIFMCFSKKKLKNNYFEKEKNCFDLAKKGGAFLLGEIRYVVSACFA